MSLHFCSVLCVSSYFDDGQAIFINVNADGKVDVIGRNSSSGTVAVWLMNGTTITSVAFPGSASTNYVIAGVGDVDGNGKSDLAWRNVSTGVVIPTIPSFFDLLEKSPFSPSKQPYHFSYFLTWQQIGRNFRL